MRRAPSWIVVTVVALLLAACSGDDGEGSAAATDAPATSDDTTDDSTDDGSEDDTTTDDSTTDDNAEPAEDALLAGAASRSLLPTVDGERAYLDDAPGWGEPGAVEPFDPGVFVAAFDQGPVDVGNGSSDAAWVHDDLRVSALALERGDERVVLVSTDTYMHFAIDADEMADRARAELPDDWADAEILVVATHNHHGPDTAFSINDDWYDLMADELAGAVGDAVAALEPATLGVSSDVHRFGVSDGRDPQIIDPTLNVLAVDGEDGPIATVVQWASHPETTLGWEPPAAEAGLVRACRIKGWEPDDCSAEGRYFTADYPGVLRTRLQEDRGGEVLYLNGAIGVQIGPGDADVWRVDAQHAVGDGWTVPAGARPVAECPEGEDPLRCESFARTEAIGTELANAVSAQLQQAAPVEIEGLTVRREEFFTELTNIGFRLLIADGDLGWQDAVLYTCDGEPSAATCEDDRGRTERDPVLTPAVGSRIRVGDVLESRITHLDLGDVGFLFVPGELPPELVIGVPGDFDDHPERYYAEPDLHATGAAYDFPGYLNSLLDERFSFTVGLGTDELGYWVPVEEYRLTCLDLVLPDGATCADLAARGVIEDPGWVGGPTCVEVTADDQAFGPDSPAVAAACRYGQALGRELGEPPGHYEETNAAGWELVDDLWAAATRLFGKDGTGRVNEDLTGVAPLRPGS